MTPPDDHDGGEPPKHPRWSALGKLEKGLALTGAVLALPTAAVGAWQVFAGGDDEPVKKPDTVAQSARNVRACERLHGMTRARDQRPLRETRHGSAFDAEAVRFRSCEWPPPVGAEPDGYSEFVKEQIYDSRFSEAENPIDDIWYSPDCRRYSIDYVSIKTGSAIPFTVRVSVGERRYIDSSPAPPGAYRDDLAPDEAAVRHSSAPVVRRVRCLAAD